MKKTKEEPLLKEKEEIQRGQVVCLACNSHRIQSIYVEQKDGVTRLTMLCMTCGNMFPIDICGSILQGTEQKITKTKAPPNYTG